jgi:hypothetical protein
MSRSQDKHGGLIPVRTMLVLLLAVLSATVLAVLAYAARHNLAEAAAAGIFALAGGIEFFDRLIT